MANTPQMPANMPITKQRTVRGEAVRRLPGAVGSEMPRFSWPGVMDSLGTSPPWTMTTAAHYNECAVGFSINDDAIEFDIKVNGSTVESITCSTGTPQLFTIDVSVSRDDEVTLTTTDFAGGTAEGTAVLLRNAA